MKKVLMAVVLLCGLSVLMESPSFAWCYTWYNRVVNPRATIPMMNIDPYLPWQSGGSARAMGMGGAYTAVANDVGGAVEYNPAGLTYLDTFTVGALAIARRTTSLNGTSGKKSNWDIIPTYAGAALKIGRVALAISRKQPEGSSSYQKFSSLQYGIYAPDGYTMYYNTLSDKFDTSGLETYAVTGAIKLSRLSLGSNVNIIKGQIKRTQRGRITYGSWTPATNSRFDSNETIHFKGYTLDVGALMDMGPLRLGASAKNVLGSVDVWRDMSWNDNFGYGGYWTTGLNWASRSTTEEKKGFARSFAGGAAIILGKVLTVDLDYVRTELWDYNKAQGRFGAELAVIPGFLFARGGVKSDFKNLVDNQDQKTMEYFVGGGLKLAMLTVDASASLIQAKSGASGDDMTGSVGATLKF